MCTAMIPNLFLLKALRDYVFFENTLTSRLLKLTKINESVITVIIVSFHHDDYIVSVDNNDYNS